MPENHPNIIFITTDTMGTQMCSAYVDRPCVETPNLERMAEEGIVFENAFCSSPVCTPARSSWYSGLHADRNGAWTNNVSMKRGVPLLAEVLNEHNYRCVHLGKWHLDGGSYNGHGKPEGGFEDPWYDITNFKREVGKDGENRFEGWNRGLEDENFCFGHRVADQAIEQMKTKGDKPLFLAVEFDEPHGPYITPPPFNGKYGFEDIPRPDTMNADMTGKPEIQKNYSRFLRNGRDNSEDLPAYYKYYYECNSYVDYEIGRVVDAARQYMDENTIIIYTSDHGDHLGSYGLCAKGPTMYDLTIRVPLIVKVSGVRCQVSGGEKKEERRQKTDAGAGLSRPLKPGTRSSSLVSGVDIFPTVLDLAGVDTGRFKPGAGYTGKSLVPVLNGEIDSVRDEVIVEYNRFGVSTDGADGFFPIRCIRTQEWKLAVNLFDTDELYSMKEDPEEQVNRIDDPECFSVRDELHDRLLAWQKRSGDPFRSPQWLKRTWRENAEYSFEGFFTTGYKDKWQSRKFL